MNKPLVICSSSFLLILLILFFTQNEEGIFFKDVLLISAENKIKEIMRLSIENIDILIRDLQGDFSTRCFADIARQKNTDDYCDNRNDTFDKMVISLKIMYCDVLSFFQHNSLEFLNNVKDFLRSNSKFIVLESNFYTDTLCKSGPFISRLIFGECCCAVNIPFVSKRQMKLNVVPVLNKNNSTVTFYFFDEGCGNTNKFIYINNYPINTCITVRNQSFLLRLKEIK